MATEPIRRIVRVDMVDGQDLCFRVTVRDQRNLAIIRDTVEQLLRALGAGGLVSWREFRADIANRRVA